MSDPTIWLALLAVSLSSFATGFAIANLLWLRHTSANRPTEAPGGVPSGEARTQLIGAEPDTREAYIPLTRDAESSRKLLNDIRRHLGLNPDNPGGPENPA